MRCIAVLAFAVFSLAAAQAADRTGLPNRTMTPGLARTDLTLQQICATTWGSDPRAVTAKMKRDVFGSYGFSGNGDARCVSGMLRRRCEIDHLIPRSIGGADDVQNLWPEPYYNGVWNATIKDKLEAKMNREVCDTTKSLTARKSLLRSARRAFMTDWRALYLKYYPHP
jgi:hypothetical protein